MKTGRLPLFAGIALVGVQLLIIVIGAVGDAAGLVWARESYVHTILFCLPAIVGIWLISMGLRRRKEIERLMRDPHQIDPWNR